MATSTVPYTTGGGQQQKQPGSLANVELRLTEEQQEYLEKQFQKTKNPHPSELMLTAAETGLLEEEVQVSLCISFCFVKEGLLSHYKLRHILQSVQTLKVFM